ncbi:MAG: helix-turn-helix transcriptional regulator, partial [Pseudolabrys sp.]
MPKPRKKTVPNSGRAHLTLRAKSNPRNGRPHARGGAQVLDLSRYAIGTRLRHARLMRGSRLKDVADAAGCSESLVSKIENNKIEPSLQVLHKLCAVLKIGLGELFTQQEEDAPVVTRDGQRSRIEMD